MFSVPADNSTDLRILENRKKKNISQQRKKNEGIRVEVEGFVLVRTIHFVAQDILKSKYRATLGGLFASRH